MSAIADRIAGWAARTPDATALVDGPRALSYRALDRLANRLAHRMVRQGISPETVVAICMPRGAGQVVAALAAWRAHAAWLPIDPAWPEERRARLVRENQARLVIHDGKEKIAAPPAIAFDPDDPLDGEPDAAPATLFSPSQLAYVICTSGSTGAPKGVAIEQRAVACLVDWSIDAFGLTARDRMLHAAQPTFDASVWEVWPTLAAGGCVPIADDEARASPFGLRDWMAEQGVTVAFLPTPSLELLLSRAWPAGAVPSLRLLLTGGDRLHRLTHALPFPLFNNYGPTEATVVTTSGLVAPGDGAPHIGRPVPHARVHLLDENRAPVAAGAVGELFIGGGAVARGYHLRPDLTDERFADDPDVPGGRLYRSGDLARLRSDGNYEFVGRTDDQVKLRGVRIEPGEIEAALLAHPAIVEACVVLRGEAAADRQLVAHLACAQPVSDESLTALLSRSLPGHMIPTAFVRWPSLPRTPHGKIDRRALR